MEWLQRICFLLSMVCLIKADVKTACTPPPPNSTGIVKPTIASQFSIHSEMFDVIHKSVTEITEYYDGPGKRAALFIKENAGKAKQYYRFDQQLFLLVSEYLDDECIPEPINEGDHRMGFMMKNGSRHILPPSSVLRFNLPGQVENYMGREVIRGIQTDHWYSCVNLKNPKANLAIDWYFSAAGVWETSGQSEQVPVRRHIRGFMYETATKTNEIDEYTEFYHYQTGLPEDQTVFDTPRGLICKMKNDPKKPPEIPTVMSFRLEHIDTETLAVTYSDEIYDFDSGITKHVYMSPGFFTYKLNPLTLINDFNTGVSYNIDMILGNCTVRPISQLPTDVERVDSRHVRMTTPQEFFQLKDHFYEGVRTTREIESDVWIGTKLDKLNKTYRTEWFFAKSMMVGQESNTGHALVHFAEYRDGQRLPSFLSNVFDFTQDTPDILQFDVSRCYKYTERENFAIHFDKKYAANIATSMARFKIDLVASIINALAISPLRIQHVDVKQLMDGGTVASMEILGPAPKIGDVVYPVKEKSLAEASSKFHQILKNGTLEVFIQNFGKLLIANPTEYTLDINKENLPTRYSGGTMFALAFVMTLVGMVLAAIMIYKINAR